MVKCPKCGEDIPIEEYPSHYESCQFIKVNQVVCLFCGEEHASHDCPYVSERARMLIYDVVDFDDVLKILFDKINSRLKGPKLDLEIHRVQRGWYAIDAYSGVPGKVIFTINILKTGHIQVEDVASIFMHEILHHKYPEFEEERIEEVLREKWKELYKGIQFPREEIYTYYG